MAGQATNNDFMLGVAELQIGPQADLFDLTHEHSLGLVKNLTLNSDPTYVELTQGVKNTIVDSAQTNNATRITAEVYQFDSANVKYALGLDGSVGVVANAALTVQTAADADDLEVVVTGDVTATATAGKWLVIEQGDSFHVAKIASSALTTGNTTVTLTGYALPFAITTAARISLMNAITVGSKEDQPYLSAKALGVLSNGDRWYMMVPKLRVVRGFSMAFTTENYGNMPIELTPYEQTSEDVNYGKMPTTDGTVYLFKRD